MQELISLVDEDHTTIRIYVDTVSTMGPWNPTLRHAACQELTAFVMAHDQLIARLTDELPVEGGLKQSESKFSDALLRTVLVDPMTPEWHSAFLAAKMQILRTLGSELARLKSLLGDASAGGRALADRYVVIRERLLRMAQQSVAHMTGATAGAAGRAHQMQWS